jgi:NitT/TauT family transport system substrate-binding protein
MSFRQKLLGLLALAVASFTLAVSAQAADLPVVRVGVLKFGTVNWELDVIREHKLDEKHGFKLDVTGLGGKNASAVAMQGGAVDVIVTDWLWVSHQRAAGKSYTFAPWSNTVGGLMVSPDSGINSIDDLKGKQLGIAGGPVDKSWLLLRAWAKKEKGLDLAAAVEPKFGAPPLLNELALRGDLPAVINFWHFAAKLQAAGFRQLVSTQDALRSLGVDNDVPLLGWVFDEIWAGEHRAAIDGFLAASYEAKSILASSDAEWERLKPRTKAKSDGELAALRDAFRAGIPQQFGDAEIDAAKKAFAVLAAEGGEKLVGKQTALADGTFWAGFRLAK